jgi:GntR family transcriptional regulator
MNSELHIKPGKDLAPQIYEFYRNKICFGDYKPGDKLPSYKSLAEKYAVSYSPIKTAYQSLEREGYIHLSTKGSIVIEQQKTVKENIASKLDEILQTALDFGAAKEDIVEAIDFIMEKYC